MKTSVPSVGIWKQKRAKDRHTLTLNFGKRDPNTTVLHTLDTTTICIRNLTSAEVQRIGEEFRERRIAIANHDNLHQSSEKGQ